MDAFRSIAPVPVAAAAERSFPLVALFHLATAWATTTACIDGRRLQEILNRPASDLRELAVAVGAAWLAGAALGAILGLGQLRKWRSMLIGALVGSLYGLTILAALAAPAGLMHGVAAATILLVTTIAVRLRAP